MQSRKLNSEIFLLQHNLCSFLLRLLTFFRGWDGTGQEDIIRIASNCNGYLKKYIRSVAGDTFYIVFVSLLPNSNLCCRFLKHVQKKSTIKITVQK